LTRARQAPRFCSIFGSTAPFTEEQFAALYGDHGGFASAWNRATQDAVKAGILLPADARLLRVVAVQPEVLE
jgi:hypothetical protein